MGIARSAVLCFVIDTTGSMSDDIDEARAVVNEIIDTKKGTQDEPSEYILVPFNDPGMCPKNHVDNSNKGCYSLQIHNIWAQCMSQVIVVSAFVPFLCAL